ARAAPVAPAVWAQGEGAARARAHRQARRAGVGPVAEAAGRRRHFLKTRPIVPLGLRMSRSGGSAREMRGIGDYEIDKAAKRGEVPRRLVARDQLDAGI